MSHRVRPCAPVLLALLVAVACSDGTRTPAAEPGASRPDTSGTSVYGPYVRDTLRAGPETDVGWSAPGERAAAAGSGMATLESVDTGRHATFDRVVFTFAERLPGYEASYAEDALVACGSGHTVDVPGAAHLAVRMEPARAHDDGGRATTAREADTAALTAVRGARITCDFEGQVAWAVGVDTARAFRILTLDAPPRLVLDVRHD